MIRRFLCWLGLHELRPGVEYSSSIVWCCRACGHLSPGGLAERRRR